MSILGTSDLDVFGLNLGGNTFGWTTDEATSHGVLDEFVEAGGNFVDSADSYSVWVEGNSGGESERIIGSWLAKGDRERLVVATKVAQHPEFPGLSARNVAAAADASLTRLGTDYIDLYYAHQYDPNTPIAESAAAFDVLVRSGKIRHIGLSNFPAERIDEWFAVARAEGFAAPVALQPKYNLVAREDFETELAEVSARHQLAVLPYFSLASGFLTGKYRSAADLEGKARGGMAAGYLNDHGLSVVDALVSVAEELNVEAATVALAWLRSRDNVVAPIASASSVEQLPALMASATLELSDEQLQILNAVSEPVKVG
ncbi:alcohol dehydrogenase [Arthrobacter sp. UCD-GKA]|uniref:Aldo/keto reductase n=1 Tax=Paeniglutamicibacter gangotriensis TaxID=254787 RepID=A0A5B0E5N3_9MICC|nr:MULTISPECIES: aldo/keto reductase [Micrococcaceae]KAA0974173.1 aldo/keto reductase [Paeniglutamicibacter gangotriensis]OIH85373.1 alcohol dehydrogenase [Arthrobacter sp. UCD-GKA]